MIETYLLNYGVLGLWTITLIVEKIKFQAQMIDILTKINKKLK